VNQYYGACYPFFRIWSGLRQTSRLPIPPPEIRAHHRLRTPDALQVATAIGSGASAILTNDAGIARVSGVDVEVLDPLRH
jgi:hypothetical protein